MAQVVGIASLVASIVSLAVGILAIWLVLMLYRMASQRWEQGEATCRRVDQAVEQLGALPGRLAGEAPGLKSLEAKLEAQIAELRQEVDGKLGLLAERTVQTEAGLRDLARR